MHDLRQFSKVKCLSVAKTRINNLLLQFLERISNLLYNRKGLYLGNPIDVLPVDTNKEQGHTIWFHSDNVHAWLADLRYGQTRDTYAVLGPKQPGYEAFECIYLATTTTSSCNIKS